MTAVATERTDRRQQLNEHIDILDVLGLDAGADWFLWRRPSNGRVELCLARDAGAKIYQFITGHAEVLAAVRKAGASA